MAINLLKNILKRVIGYKDGANFQLVESDNPLPVIDKVANTLVPDVYDYIAVTYPTSTTEVYTFRDGGDEGTLVSTITLTYTDANKTDLSTVSKA